MLFKSLPHEGTLFPVYLYDTNIMYLMWLNLPNMTQNTPPTIGSGIVVKSALNLLKIPMKSIKQPAIWITTRLPTYIDKEIKWNVVTFYRYVSMLVGYWTYWRQRTREHVFNWNLHQTLCRAIMKHLNYVVQVFFVSLLYRYML